MVNASPVLYDDKDFELMKSLWVDVNEKMYGMRDLYDNYYIDHAGEDSDGLPIWKRNTEKSGLLKYT